MMSNGLAASTGSVVTPRKAHSASCAPLMISIVSPAARAMAALYQMMLAGGELNGTRIVSPRTLQYAIRNHTGDRIDEFMGMPMHRGLGPHLRGTTENVRGLGATAHPTAFGHGGVGSSYSWADPTSGVSFTYLTNYVYPDPWHSMRLDRVLEKVSDQFLIDLLEQLAQHSL